MRFIALAAVAALSVGFVNAPSASAATWQCVGPEVACGGARTATKKATYSKAAHQKKASRSATAQKRAAKRFAARTPAASPNYGGGSTGIASYYWQPQRVASGGYFNPNALTAAHRTLPFGTRVVVTNLNNGRSVTVTINDRGPFIKGRIIDLSKRAAGVIGMTGSGLARVSVQRL